MAKPFTVVKPVAGSNGQLRPSPSSAERHPHTRVNPEDSTDDPADLKRVLGQVQDNAIAATTPYRTNPLLNGELHKKVAVVANTHLHLKHGLGEPFGGYWSTRAYSDASGAFAAVEAPFNDNLDPSQYLALVPTVSGTFDIVITPG